MRSNFPHDIERLQGIVGQLRANLYSFGLKLHGCEWAYLGALSVGASAADAFEAARQCALIQTPEDAWGDTNPQRRYQRPREYEEMIARQRKYIDEIRSLPNPFEIGEIKQGEAA